MSRFGAQQFAALFEPRGVVVAGASSHPGKFGFVALHNLLVGGYKGRVFATNLQGESVLGIDTLRSIDELPQGAVDLVFVCTPPAANLELLRACAAKGVRAAFVTTAGYGEAGPDGALAEREMVALANELGILLAGPNGQGVVSTPAQLCAQIVAPYPPQGRIGVVSQSGNFVSSFLNWSCATGVGISRAVSAGNAAAVTVADYLDFYATDDATGVGLAYVEGISDGRAFYERARRSRSACRWYSSKEALPKVARAPPPATPARWPPTTKCSTGHASRPASCVPQRSKRRSRLRPPLRRSHYPPGPTWSC